MFVTTPGKLNAAGVIGMNHRNVVCIARNNPRRLYPRVDNKLPTKILAREAGIAVPNLIGVVKTQGHVRELKEFLKDEQAFVMKPAKGSGGKGILVITGRDGENYLKPSGAVVTHQDVCKHASSTLSGLFSLGLDIGTGKALKAIQHGRPIIHHPDTGKEFSTFHVPEWPESLKLASRCYEITELGYLGADIVLDAQKGPLILELNARPGLAIQMTNGIGMQTRFAAVEPEIAKNHSPDERVTFSQENF